MVAFAERERLSLSIQEKERGRGIGSVRHRGGAGKTGIAGDAVDLLLYTKRPTAGIRGILKRGVGLEDHGTQKVFLGEKQLGFPVTIDIRGAGPGLLDGTAGWGDVDLFEILSLHLAENFDFLIRNECHQVG